MAFLKVLKGSCPGQVLPLIGERIVLGRHPKCEIVVDNAAVSRQHAQILESHGTFYIEDLRSRNGTYLNGKAIEGRIELHDDDKLKVCDVVLSFHDKLPTVIDPAGPGSAVRARGKLQGQDSTGDLLEDGDPIQNGNILGGVTDKSSIISTMNAVTGSSFRLGINPEAKLRAVLEIGAAIGRVLNMEEVLDRALDGLFKIFPQADEGFVLLKDPKTKKLIVRASKSRLAGDEAIPRISTTIIKQAMQTGDAILSADALTDKRFSGSDSLSDLRIRSIMCVPLISNSQKLQGVMQIDTQDVGQQFSQSDLDVMVSVASQVTLAVENARLHEEVLKQRVLERDLEFATQVQLGFLPSERPKPPGYEFYDFYEAALRVGGDYFDYVKLPGNRVAIAVGDVAGKGVPAALLMARLFSSARYQLLTAETVADALTGLNSEMASSGLGHRFITCVLAILEPDEHRFRIANAGHLPPVVRRANSEIELIALEESGMPLGIAPSQQFNEVVLDLQVGDACVFYTDGITEAMNPQNDLYGRGRLCQFIANGPDDPASLVKGLIADIESFAEDRAQADDMCVVALKRSE